MAHYVLKWVSVCILTVSTLREVGADEQPLIMILVGCRRGRRWRCAVGCVDVAVDRHGGDAAGGGDFGHGELAGVIHPLGLVDQGGGHLGFAPAAPASGSGGS
jgi:hypothetical protein